MFIGVSSLVYRLVIEGDLKLKTPKNPIRRRTHLHKTPDCVRIHTAERWLDAVGVCRRSSIGRAAVL
jgi:hypothetical protein